MTNELVDPTSLLEEKISENSKGEEGIYAEAEEVVSEFAGLTVTKVHQRSPYLNMLVYGDSGVGKTQLLGSANAIPELRPVLLLDIEGGTETLRHTYPDVEIVRVRRWQQINDVYTELRRGKHKYKTFCVDSLTELQKFNMDNIMAELQKSDPGRDADIPSIREWGKTGNQMRQFVRFFRDLEMNVFFSALEKTDKNTKTGVTERAPDLPGKLSSQVAAFLDIVTYYYIRTAGQGEDRKLERRMLTKRTDAVIAKDRTGKLPMVVKEPTLTMLWEKIYGTDTDSKSNTATAQDVSDAE